MFINLVKVATEADVGVDDVKRVIVCALAGQIADSVRQLLAAEKALRDPLVDLAPGYAAEVADEFVPVFATLDRLADHLEELMKLPEAWEPN